MTRSIAAACLLAMLANRAEAAIEAEHPSDYVRVLEAGPAEQWDEATVGLLGDDNELNKYAVASVVRRVTSLSPGVRERVAAALRAHGHTLPTLWMLAHVDPDPGVRETAMDSLLRSHGTGRMDMYRALIDASSPSRLDALNALIDAFEDYTEIVVEGSLHATVDPVMEPRNGTPSEIFDRRYLPSALTLLYSPDPKERAAALWKTAYLDTPGLRNAWLSLARDPDPSIRSDALLTLAKTGDPRPCATLFAELTEEDDVREVGWACAPTHYIDYLEQYLNGKDAARNRLMIEGATHRGLLAHPKIVEAMTSYTGHADAFVSETANQIADWHADSLEEEHSSDMRAGIQPAFLVVSAFASFVLGAVLFVWAFRLFGLFVRVRHRPVVNIASMPMGPVALEGKVQPASGTLRHPLTDEPCVYYAGADVDHPETRFYLVDDSGKVLIDPRRAVLFSEDGVLTKGEAVRLVGHASGDYGKVGVGKDSSTPPLYRRLGHRLIELLFGFGQKTSVTKMLFTDPTRCFWIWDDVERRPMGEARDVLWLGASLLLAGAWIAVFAVSILGMIDQEMSATLARALEALTS